MGVFFFSSRRRHTRLQGDWSSDVCSSDLTTGRENWQSARPRLQRAFEQSWWNRSEEHTSELQSPCNLVCRLLLEKKNKNAFVLALHIILRLRFTTVTTV